MSTRVDDLPVVTEPSRDFLTRDQLSEYRSHRRELLAWMLTLGKNPDQIEGYAFDTVRYHAYRLDKFSRWVWSQEGRYTLDIQHRQADGWLERIAYSDASSVHKVNCVKALKIYFRWRHHRFGDDLWESQYHFRSEDHYLRDYLTSEERQKIREASLEYGSIPSFRGLSPKERDSWQVYLAQRLGKSKSEIVEEDWKRVNCSKFPSLVWTSLDSGLRPVEVERSRVCWVDTANNVLRIPKEDSAKNRENWTVALQEETTRYLAVVE